MKTYAYRIKRWPVVLGALVFALFTYLGLHMAETKGPFTVVLVRRLIEIPLSAHGTKILFWVQAALFALATLLCVVIWVGSFFISKKLILTSRSLKAPLRLTHLVFTRTSLTVPVGLTQKEIPYASIQAVNLIDGKKGKRFWQIVSDNQKPVYINEAYMASEKDFLAVITTLAQHNPALDAPQDV